jgi:hypothetical protein
MNTVSSVSTQRLVRILQSRVTYVRALYDLLHARAACKVEISDVYIHVKAQIERLSGGRVESQKFLQALVEQPFLYNGSASCNH